MRKVLLTVLVVVTGSTWAAWVKVTDTNLGTVYIDSESLSKDGNLRKVWEVHNLTERGADGAMSRLSKHEYDCKEQRRRGLAVRFHPEPMAGGEPIAIAGADPNGWIEIPPQTIAQSIMKKVCAQ